MKFLQRTYSVTYFDGLALCIALIDSWSAWGAKRKAFQLKGYKALRADRIKW